MAFIGRTKFTRLKVCTFVQVTYEELHINYNTCIEASITMSTCLSIIADEPGTAVLKYTAVLASRSTAVPSTLVRYRSVVVTLTKFSMKQQPHPR